MIFPGGGKKWPVAFGHTGSVVKFVVRGQRAQPYMLAAFEEADAYVNSHLDELVNRIVD
jgi:hypothetical protein